MHVLQWGLRLPWRIGSLALVCLLSIFFAPQAHAIVGDNLLIDPAAMAMGNAVTADPPGINSIHFNPAGLARIPTGKFKTDTIAIIGLKTEEHYRSAPDMDMGGFSNDPLNETASGPVKLRLYIPGLGMLPWRFPGLAAANLGFSFSNEGSPFTFGSAVYIPFAFSADRQEDPDDPSRFQGKIVHMQRLVYLSPAVGYKYSDTLRFGVAVPIAHQAIFIDTDMRMPNKLLGITGSLQKGFCGEEGKSNVIDTFTVGLCGGGKDGLLDPFKKAANMSMELTTPFDPTLNLGVLWEPTKSFGLGLTYQGGSKTVYHGRYSFKTDPMLRAFVQGLNSSLLGPMIGGIAGLPQYIPPIQSGNVVATIPFPDKWQLGFKVRPTEKLQLNMDVSYTDWAKWDAFQFKFDQDIYMLQMARMFGFSDSTQVTMNQGLQNVFSYGFGVQYDVTPKLSLRLGYEPRKSSIPLNQITVLAPLPDTVVRSVGARLKLEKDTEINLAFSYMSGSYSVPARTNCNLNCDHFFNVVYNPYAAMDVEGAITIRYFGFSLTHRF